MTIFPDIRALFFKANSHHDERGRFARAPSTDQEGGSSSDIPNLPPSAGIDSPETAAAYWKAHIQGRRVDMQIKVQVGPAKGRVFKASVIFGQHNSHMWTRKAASSEVADYYDNPHAKTSPRKFEQSRAVLMDRLFRTIALPWRTFTSPDVADRHIYLGSPPLPGGGSYVVVLGPAKSDFLTYGFVTAQPRTKGFTAKLMAHAGAIPLGEEIQKSETPPYEGGALSYPGSTRLAGPLLVPTQSEDRVPLLSPLKADRLAVAR